MAKNKKKSKGPQHRSKSASNNQVNAAPKKEKKAEQKPVEAKAEKAAPAPKAQETKPKAKAAESEASAAKEKSFFSGIVDSVKKLVKTG